MSMMELDKLEQSVKKLNEAVNEFPVGAISLDDFRPIEEKIFAMRESLMRANARLLMLRAKHTQYMTDARSKQNVEEIKGMLQKAACNVLINAKAIKLCLHSTTILSIFSGKEGDIEDQRKLYTYMSKLFTLNDSIISIQESIEKLSQEQLDLKIQCQKALFDYKNFLKEQEEIQSKKLQETNPEIVRNKSRMEKTIRKINIMKKLTRNFIAASGNLLAKEPLLLEMLENHRELINIETIIKTVSQNNENDDV